MMPCPLRLLHVLAAADIGGTEVLCREMVRHLAANPEVEQHICCVFPGAEVMRRSLEEASGHDVSIAATAPRVGRIPYVRAFRRICRDVQPNAVILHFLGLDAIFLALAARSVGIRAVMSKAGNPAPRPDTDWRRARKWQVVITILRRLHVPIIAPSHWVHASLRRLGRLPDRSCVIHNGIDYDRADAEAYLGRRTRIDHDCFVIGTVGRLEKIKDVATLLRALAIVKAARPMTAWRLEVVGDGPDRANLESLARDLGLAHDVAFLGSCPNVERILGGWDLAVVSTTRDEGFGMVLIEAMAAGLDLLASDVPACREVLDDGAFGTLFRPGDADDLAGLIAVRSDTRDACTKTPRGRDRYDIGVCGRAHLALIARMLAAHD